MILTNKSAIMLLGILALAACSTSVAQESDTCGASTLQWLVSQPESALEGLLLPNPHRVIHPNSMITMDYSPDRLNIRIDANGAIAELNCG